MKPLHTFYETKFEENLKFLNNIQEKSGAKILCAFKGYAPWHSSWLVSKYLSGVAVSSINESTLAYQYFSELPVHTYCPAYSSDTINQLIERSDVMVFNSLQDLKRFYPLVPEDTGIDIRLNLQHSVVSSQVFDGYNPSKPFSRFGVTLQEWRKNISTDFLGGISGVHFHSLNQQNAEDLGEMVNVLEENFGGILNLPHVKRLNLGGGHALTREGYNVDLLVDIIKHLRSTYNVDVYLEPSEFIFHNVGTLEAEVLSIVHNEVDIAILNVSAKNHMPDIIESPYYYAPIKEGEYQGSGSHQYILGGNTCLTGDVIGTYSFDKPLKVGDKITFLDQTAYTMSQSSFFNGIDKPTLKVIGCDRNIKLEKEFAYIDYFKSL